MTVTGGKAVVEQLVAEDVRHVFGLIGSAGMEIFDALHDTPRIRFIGVRDERTGTHMADGYARTSGRAGVILAGQNGPGATNLVTGLAQASAAYSPVVALAGSLSSAHVYRDAFQEVDQAALFRPVTKGTWTVPQAARLPEMVRHAFRTALTPRQGPVVLNMPRDLLAANIDAAGSIAPVERQAQTAACATSQAIGAAAALLAGAARPLILAGGGVKNGRAADAVLALAERLGAPVALSPGHGDALPCTHPLYAGQVGPRGNAVATGLAKAADVILALGTRLGFNTTFYTYDHLSPTAKIIQVELDASAIGRFFPVAIGIHANAADTARALDQALQGQSRTVDDTWLPAFQQHRAELLAQRDAAGAVAPGRIQPAQVFRALRATAPADALFTMDAGTLCLQATDQLDYRRTPALLTPLDFGLVGFSYACGLGAKLAAPDRTVISLMGDGGFGMTSSEIGTAVQHGINTVCVVMNNGCWGAEKAYQRDFFGGRYLGADIPNPPYDRLAELWGAAGFRVEQARDLAPVLAQAISCGRPAIVDVMVDPDALYSFRRDSFQHRVAAAAS
ncbi:MAG: thiamine pyrophosphate-binding protein [Burkholderiaceae bacterium]|jgi:acetolactate synthase-1/2/3 large subunit/sulfoacetaldehyde acetyltransferase|nr:thiamine pyrophosphate-binding protein [Burkholderiaceae bacterium]